MTERYLPIEAYGAIGNLRTVALVGRHGGIDWCALPSLDSPSVFAALLDSERGGTFAIRPVRSNLGEQHYVEDSNVLQTVFTVDGGRLTLTDFMPLDGDIRGCNTSDAPPELHRLVELDGEVELLLEWAPRFDYARQAVTLERVSEGLVARGGDARLALGGVLQDANVVERYGGPCLTARMTLGAGEYAFVAKWDNDDARTSVSDSRRQLQTTLRTWERWLHKDGVSGDREWAGSWREHVKRSELALKLLTYADTGAIAAAATTSLPETIGGVRNWDYRFTWIRDAALTAQALYALGHDEEAKAFIHWAERVAAKHRHDDIIVRLMYGLRGETELDEEELEHLEGYRASKPVRIGNEAAVQLQLDIYGELIGAAYELVRKGDTFEADVWDFLPHLADGACSHWRQDDYGIWEMRNGPKPFVYSKAMVWTALDRAITLARDYGLDGDAGRWRKTCEEVRTELLTKGYDDKLNAFVLEYGSKDLDAANLLLPLIEFLPPDDPRVQGTIDRTFEQLTERDLVYRYKADDGLPGEEGAFVLCTFWMVDALALSGRLDEAHRIFEGVASRANHVGLLSEQIDPHSGRFLGNFPQAFSHLGLINSLLYLAYAEGRDTPVPDPVGSSEHRQQNGR